MAARLVVIRIRGSANVNEHIEDSLRMLKLKRVNNAVLIDDRPSYNGMIHKVKDYVTWGPVDAGEVSLLLKNRGEVKGAGKLTEEHIKANTKFKSIDAFSKAYVEFKAELSQIPGLKPFFRLHPPRKGHRSIKRSFSIGGSLGNRGKDIKQLVHKMR